MVNSEKYTGRKVDFVRKKLYDYCVGRSQMMNKYAPIFRKMAGNMEKDTKELEKQEFNTDSELNPVTGLYHNRFFFKKAKEYLTSIEPGTHCLVAIDIEHFRIFNKLYGRQEGDRLLFYIAEVLRKIRGEHGGVAGYIGGDNFAMLMPNSEKRIRQMEREIAEGIKQWNDTMGFWPAMGVYLIEDISLSVGTMYDRATIALSRVMGNYTNRLCQYSPDMEDSLEEELQLLAEVQDGLRKEEFIFFVQPQCNISSGKIVGGEALVRWKHSTKGMIPPGVFIPVLEKNGFIADLDRYVWRKVCKWLRECLDRGYHAIPVSINISRIDIFSMDVAEYLKELVEEYQIPTRLLKVEITESAYAENSDKIIRTVKQLREADFLVMMDDFGSGYSSLNMLKSVSVDVLKMDMRFLEINEKEEEKGIGILESVVNMARQMQMPIIVEGVETKKQESFLRKMGCRYTQGYYYYKPLPVEEFEQLLANERNLDFDGFYYNQNEAFHVREFLDENLFNDTIMNNILGAAAFYEMYENCIEIVRVNEQYYRLAGVPVSEKEEYRKRFWNHVYDDDRHLLVSVFEQAYDNPGSGADGYVHYLRADGTVLWIYIKVFFMREKDGRKLFYGSLTDMTGFKERKTEGHMSEQSVEELTEKQLNYMEEYYGDMPCGYLISKIILDEKGSPCDYEIVYGNKEIERMCGGDMEKLHYMIQKTFVDNREEMLNEAYRAAYFGEKVEYNTNSILSGRYLKLTFYQYEYGYASCLINDVTHNHIYEDALNHIVKSYRAVYFIHLKENYVRMIYPDESQLLERGNYEEFLNRHVENGRIVDEDGNVRRVLSLQNLRNVFMVQDSVEYKYRRVVEGIGEEWCLTTITVSKREKNGAAKTAIGTIRSIEALVREKENMRKLGMSKALSSMTEGFLVYRAAEDEKILYANPTVLKIFGCETLEEFLDLVGASFRGMVHPEDVDRVEREIRQQVQHSDRNMDFTQYRIIRKDGQVRWIDDCGHLEDAGFIGDTKLFYVFISDITQKITEEQKERIFRLNQQ